MNQHKTLTFTVSAHVDPLTHALRFAPHHPTSPMHTLLAALGECSLITLHGICQRQRQQVSAYRAELSAQQRMPHPQLLQSVQLQFVVIGSTLDETRVQHAVELLPKYCPVHATVAMASPISHTLTILTKELR